MVNYASALNQSELGKYFEWIVIKIINHLNISLFPIGSNPRLILH